MTLTNEQVKKLKNEVIFQSSRSSGPGGQHVNKVNTKVELRFNIANSTVLSTDQKSRLLLKLKHKINATGELLIMSQLSRSQLKNKHDALTKFIELITYALIPPKRRKPTKPSRVSKQKRLENKKRQSLKKKQRRKIL